MTKNTDQLIAEHNASARLGFPDRVDPRDDYNHPLHDIVCGWCGEVNCSSTSLAKEDAV